MARVLMELPSQWSDGESKYWPVDSRYVYRPDDRLYHDKLADQWMEHIGRGVTATKYRFTALPANYRIYTKTRNDGVGVDRYIFGHKKGRFDSPIKFFQHFKFISSSGTIQCECVNCSAKATSRNGSQGARPQGSTKLSNVSAASTSQLMDFLRICQNNPDVDIKQLWPDRPSIEDLVDGMTFQKRARKYMENCSSLPRRGEIVLFQSSKQSTRSITTLSDSDSAIGHRQLELLDSSPWRAGFIANEPFVEEDHESLVSLEGLKGTKQDVTWQIQLCPDPGNPYRQLVNNLYSVTIEYIRPFNMYHEVLSPIPQDKWHETIHHALKSMCTISFVDQMFFRYQYPFGGVQCYGVWIGPELFVLKDAVRLMPLEEKEPRSIDSTLIIDEIEWCFHHFKFTNQYSTIIIRGNTYTTNKNKAYNREPIRTEEDKSESICGLGSNFRGYTWYQLFEGQVEIPASMIIGRLYEKDRMQGLLKIDHFNAGHEGLRHARARARRTSPYLDDSPESGWTITNDRIEALKVETLRESIVGRGREREERMARESYIYGLSEKTPRRRVRKSLLVNADGSRMMKEQHTNMVDELVENGGTVETIDGIQNVRAYHEGNMNDESRRFRKPKSIGDDRTSNSVENECRFSDDSISDTPIRKMGPSGGSGDVETAAQASGEEGEGSHNEQRAIKRRRV